ncbi:hypothetical protein CH282_15595, partial [Rhodococcus sp. 06-418-1B]
TVAAVARELGVTRQTVYRYFPDVDQLLLTAARREASSFVELLITRLANVSPDSDAVVEALAFVIEELPRWRVVAAATVEAGATTMMSIMRSPNALEHLHDVATRSGIGWHRYGVRDDEVEDFIEHLIRTVHSLLLCPPPLGWSPTRLREHLSRWVVPVVDAHPDPVRRHVT